MSLVDARGYASLRDTAGSCAYSTWGEGLLWGHCLTAAVCVSGKREWS